MDAINYILDSTFGGLSDQNYAKSFDHYRLWFDIGHTYYQIPSDQIFDTIWKYRAMNSMIDPLNCQLIHSADLILRFARDAESDHILGQHSSRLQSRLSTRALQEFIANNLATAVMNSGYPNAAYVDTNLIAHWANLGYVEENAIRNHILQSLISHPKLHDHQAYILIILFKLAGATFEAYAGPSVVDRCFELLKGHSFAQRYPTYNGFDPDDEDPNREYVRRHKELVEVSAPCTM